ncbi:MAG: 4-hydroxy-tetrahydrodipicolinate synthase [Lachnospiraceae bacterium]|nr:4-hydroxy-tetrahydrodipicolinate synthase [Lachnospiraceae bacterium]
MNKELIFKGVGTALITPTTENGIDYENLEKLIDFQIDKGINALIIAGTTGEGSTLNDKEHKDLLRFSKEKIRNRVPMIAGVGSNDTNYAISLTKYACEIDVGGLLVVTPYYNKATQYGLVQSYTAIAKASTKPIILYNVPSRTGVNIEPETYLELSKVDNIVGIKEANGNLSKIMDAFNLVGDKLYIYSGNDDEITPFLSMGGYGVISVLSNMLPKETVEICDSFFAGDVKKSSDLQLKYLPLIRALFSEVNPIPIKSAMAKLGYCKNFMRLPLTPMDKAKEEKMFSIMKGLGIIY